MTIRHCDLTIDAVLTDPMIRAAMKADGVEARAFEDLMRSTARRLEMERPASRRWGLPSILTGAARPVDRSCLCLA